MSAASSKMPGALLGPRSESGRRKRREIDTNSGSLLTKFRGRNYATQFRGSVPFRHFVAVDE